MSNRLINYSTINQLANDTILTDIPRSAYIHIPFCRRRCYYCDFPISVLGDKTDIETSPSIQNYVEILCQEIELTPVLGYPLEMIFFGGGTPSLLPVKSLNKILNILNKKFGISPKAEISMEMDPGTFTLEQLQGYQQVGVNRVSLGVQAFQDELLKICGRSHTTANIFTAIDLIDQAAIENFSLDLISGLPYQTLEQWESSLFTAIRLAPKHLSCYDLVLEAVTPFGKQYKPGQTPLPNDEITAQMYRLAQEMLTQAGYEHYEVSNYAQNSYQCRHNRVYWENKPYYGFGMGAASYTHQQRFTRPRTRREYYTWVETLQTNGGLIDCPKTSATDQLLETLMLGLRLAEGVNLTKIAQHFGTAIVKDIIDCLLPYVDQGWVKMVKTDSLLIEQIKLTDPEGFLFSNTVLTALFERLE